MEFHSGKCNSYLPVTKRAALLSTFQFHLCSFLYVVPRLLSSILGLISLLPYMHFISTKQYSRIRSVSGSVQNSDPGLQILIFFLLCTVYIHVVILSIWNF
jgi:hypothetical protein